MPATLFLPSALLPSSVAGDLMRLDTERKPSWQTVLARAQLTRRSHDSFDARCTAFEAELARSFGLPVPLPAAHCAAALEQRQPEAVEWTVELCHVRLARDHLSLMSLHGMAPTLQESDALAHSVRDLFAEAGLHLENRLAQHWAIQAPADWQLTTSTPACAWGRSIESWMPEGESAGRWRKLLNTVQMQWHEHPVNEARAERGLPPINMLWLHGGSCTQLPQPAHQLLLLPADETDPALLGLAAWARLPVVHQLPDGAPRVLAVDRRFETALQSQDWPAWLQAWRDIEERWWRPAMKTGQTLDLVLCGENTVVHAQLRPTDQWKIWRRWHADLIAEQR